MSSSTTHKIETILGAFQASGIRFEIHGERTDFDQVGTYIFNQTYRRGQIGFIIPRTGSSTWHWLNFFLEEQENDIGLLSFDHSYSQITGRSHKGYKHYRAVKKRLAKLTGIEL